MRKFSNSIVRFFGLFLTVLIVASCSLDSLSPDGRRTQQFFVDVGGAILPVMVAGNDTASVAIVFVHGGPGNSGQLFRQYKGLYDLEERYKVVYYDQRASGVTQGNTGTEDINIEQFSDDLDVIVDFTRQVVGVDIIYIMGHSWGGGLSTYHLINEEYREKVRGYIAVAPAFNIPDAMVNSREWTIAAANAFIALNIRRSFWQGALDFYAAHPVITQELFFDHFDYVDEADGVQFSTVQKVDVNLPDFQIQAYLSNFLYTQEHMTIGGEPVFESLRLNADMAAIDLPVLLIWGERDGLIPVEQAVDFVTSIGTAPEDIRYRGFTVSAHEPMAEEPENFTQEVSSFVESTR